MTTPGQATPPPPELITRSHVLTTIKEKKNELQRKLDEAINQSNMLKNTLFELTKLECDIERIRTYLPPPQPGPRASGLPPGLPTVTIIKEEHGIKADRTFSRFPEPSQPGPRVPGLPPGVSAIEVIDR